MSWRSWTGWPAAALAALAALAVALLAPVAAQADETPPEDKTLAPYFYLGNGDPAVDRLPLKGTEVEVKVAGIIADVTVTQRYRNEGTRPIEARYVFPASTRAAVYGMTMQIGERRIAAQIGEEYPSLALLNCF